MSKHAILENYEAMYSRKKKRNEKAPLSHKRKRKTIETVMYHKYNIIFNIMGKIN